jgi:SAM-dependent methyltransferase
MTSLTNSANRIDNHTEFPLQFGAEKDFPNLHGHLLTCGFSEEAICTTLNIETLGDLHSVNPVQIVWSRSCSEIITSLIKLFLLSEPIAKELLKEQFPGEIVQLFFNLGLIKINPASPEEVYATVLLYPVRDRFIASDRIGHPFKEKTKGDFFPEIVFPAIHVGTQTFLQILPDSQAESALDLCSGTGVAAILLSRSARRVVAADILPRANHFAKFNCLLNQCTHVEIVESDLYSALAGQTFDLIVTHPPYVPALTPIAIYRDGGQTGETLVRNIIGQLPKFLRRGGTFFCVCAGLDTEEGSFEQRIRGWLTEDPDAYDLLFARKGRSTPQEFMRDLMWAKQSMDSVEISQWEKVFKQIGAYGMSYGALVIHRRRDRNQPAWTARAIMSSLTSGRQIEWIFGWRRWCNQPNAHDLLRSVKPSLSPRLKVQITQTVTDGRLVPVEFMLSSDSPFYAEAKVEPSMVTILEQFDGQKTVEEIYRESQIQNLIPLGYPINQYLALIAIFIERGYLLVPEHAI